MVSSFFSPFERVTMQATKRAHQSSGAVLTGRWAWALIPYPILPLSLKSRTISMDVKHHERRRCTFSIRDVTPINLFPHTRSLWHAASCYANEILWIVRISRDCMAGAALEVWLAGLVDKRWTAMLRTADTHPLPASIPPPTHKISH